MNSAEDKFLSFLAILAVVWFICGMVRFHVPPPAKVQTSGELEVRVDSIVEAIATAEGFYAPGGYDGHSLPHKLNNPGSLKKPALGAGALSTWKDTGLIIFPTEEMGWAALRHQVDLMITGDSTVYDPSDTLLLVAGKYADGDLNWGRRVASALGVAPTATLSEIAERFRLAPTNPGESAGKVVQPSPVPSGCAVVQH